VAPRRKTDPGELFDWRGLAAAGIGLWPGVADGPADRELALAALGRVGYETGPSLADGTSEAAIKAFQRHFRPQRIDGRIDAGTAALIYGLAGMLEAPSRGTDRNPRPVR